MTTLEWTDDSFRSREGKLLGMPTFKAVLSKRKISAIATFIIEHFKGKPIVGELKE